MISVDDERLPTAGDAERRGQAVRLAGERRQSLRPFIEIARLVKDPVADHERLIGADAISVWTLRADRESLRPRQFDGDVCNRAASRTVRLLH